MLITILCACQKVADPPLLPGKQLEGTWKVYSEKYNDTIEYINDYTSYTFKFFNYNGKYGTVTQEWLTTIGGVAKYDYFYTVDDAGSRVTRYQDERDISLDLNNGGWNLILRKDSITLYNAGFDANGIYSSAYTKAYRIK